MGPKRGQTFLEGVLWPEGGPGASRQPLHASPASSIAPSLRVPDRAEFHRCIAVYRCRPHALTSSYATDMIVTRALDGEAPGAY